MDELISRIVAASGLNEDLARKALGIILAFLQKEGPTSEISQLMAALPGSQELADAEGGAKGGVLGAIGGLMGGGGGVMALGGQLMGAGLSMPQIQSVSKEMFAYGREKAGEDTMGAIVGAIPGLGQFV
ncbi:hypothetical protein GGC47_000414 [Bosea sp. OAE752]|jgi:hypothetical protein|uniref:DUF2267 domain-containing protein n=1 Tax=Bosea spartocytisi TaxID=2773451 RepID=A0A927E5N1_9HYPH|nr:MULTISPECIES: hypothetical protein [Bosea]MBD3844552.1 DUF2267 domain-containing protein [Bosea spartocytisi]MCT4470341.1 DUF2267 domain-containing protein [Bosea spartocytisi]